jgi:hypothetical protein
MDTKPLSERELKRLVKLDGKLARGLLRLFLLATLIGFIGGLCWVGLMLLMAPGFGENMHFHAPTGDEQHALLELTLYWLVTHFGAMTGICLLAGGLFAGLGAFVSLLTWPALVRNHADLARRALVHGQFQPQFISAQLRRGSMRA